MTVLSDVWIVSSTHFLKLLYYVFLSDLKCEADTADKLVNCLIEIWNNTLIQIHEFFRLTTVEETTLHCADFKSLIKNLIYYLPSQSCCYNVRFYQT